MQNGRMYNTTIENAVRSPFVDSSHKEFRMRIVGKKVRSSSSVPGTRRKFISKKFNRMVCPLVAFACLSMALLNREYVSIISHARRLKCRSRSNSAVNGTENGDEEPRYLSKFDSLIDRILETEGPDLCDTPFPAGAVDTVFFTADSAEAQEEPAFVVAPSDPDLYTVTTLQSENGVFLLVPFSDEGQTLDETERDLISTYETQIYDAATAVAKATTEDEDTIAYVVTLTGCAEWYHPPGSADTGETVLGAELYEASAVIKTQVCEMTDQAAANRRLGKTRKLRKLEETGQLSAAEMGYTMHALVHPMAVECPLQGTSGETYDRVKLLQSENYVVEILGHPITDDDFAITNQYIKDNIQNDVGIRDSTKLQVWTMTLHPVVVLMDYNSVLQKPMDEEIDFLLADESLKGLYILGPPDENTGKAGVDTGFLIIKPSLKEFDRIVSMYIKTPFDPETGWNGFGYHQYKGDMGISGFLNWYFHNDQGYLELDRCIYAHDADEDCLGRVPFSEAKHLKMYDRVCGKARHCPYDHPDWSEEKSEACTTLHRRYYEFRYEFEQKYFQKKYKCSRIGFFKQRSFLGYCRGPGEEGFMSMTGDVIEKPEWMIVCPPTTQCPEGTFMTNECTCTAPDDPCAACPSNTVCQISPTLMCIDCDCGFCDVSSLSCCESGGQNNCQSGRGVNLSCNKGNNYFPAFVGYENVCESVQFSKTAMPNGCGCKPTSHSPCTYNKEWGTKEEKCFICSADDLSAGQCETCKDCLAQCINSNDGCINASFTREDFMSCMGTIIDADCRSNCHYECMKN